MLEKGTPALYDTDLYDAKYLDAISDSVQFKVSRFDRSMYIIIKLMIHVS